MGKRPEVPVARVCSRPEGLSLLEAQRAGRHGGHGGVGGDGLRRSRRGSGEERRRLDP